MPAPVPPGFLWGVATAHQIEGGVTEGGRGRRDEFSHLRFGIASVDRLTGDRQLERSGRWFGDFVRAQGTSSHPAST